MGRCRGALPRSFALLDQIRLPGRVSGGLEELLPDFAEALRREYREG